MMPWLQQQPGSNCRVWAGCWQLAKHRSRCRGFPLIAGGGLSKLYAAAVMDDTVRESAVRKI
jgi:hypothetical protein